MTGDVSLSVNPNEKRVSYNRMVDKWTTDLCHQNYIAVRYGGFDQVVLEEVQQ